MQKNAEIRRLLKERNVKQWELADALGVNEGTVCRLLRHELDNATTAAIIKAINEYTEKREATA